MQTFLPYPSFRETAAVLDNRRLGNQCYNETYVLINGGWPNHPASKMWKNHKRALAKYGLYLALEMEIRGSWSQEICLKWVNYYSKIICREPDTGNPNWLGNDDFHASHRSNLLRKNFEWYSRFNWKEPNNLPYIWPS